MVITVSRGSDSKLSDYKKLMGMLMSKNDIPQIQKEFVNYINVSCRSLAINNTLEGVMEKGHTIPEYRTGESFIVNFRYNLISNQLTLVDIDSGFLFGRSGVKKIPKALYDVDIILEMNGVELSDIFRNKGVEEILQNAISDSIINSKGKIPFPLKDTEDEVDDFIESLYDLSPNIRQSILEQVKENVQGWNIFGKVSEKLNL